MSERGRILSGDVLKYFAKRLLINRWYIIVIILLSLMSCSFCGYDEFSKLIIWQFGGFSYDFIVDKDVPLNYLIFVFQLLLILGTGSLTDIKNNNINVMIRFGRERFWIYRSIIVVIQVALLIFLIMAAALLVSVMSGVNIYSAGTAAVLKGIIINTFPMCVISLQGIMTMQLIINPILADMFYGAVMISILFVAERHMLIDNMFTYRSALVFDDGIWLSGIRYMFIWIGIVMAGCLIARRKDLI